jgi:putative Mn2+ efflux pump MntP
MVVGSPRFRKAPFIMPTWTLLLIDLGVSADAFAVALGKGLHATAARA